MRVGRYDPRYRDMQSPCRDGKVVLTGKVGIFPMLAAPTFDAPVQDDTPQSTSDAVTRCRQYFEVGRTRRNPPACGREFGGRLAERGPPLRDCRLRS